MRAYKRQRWLRPGLRLRTFRDLGHGRRVGVWVGFSHNLGVVAIGNKFGNGLVMVTTESAKLDTRFLPELMLTVNKNSNKLSALLPILALGFVLAPALAGIVEPISVDC